MSVKDLKQEVMEGWPEIPAASVALQIIEFMGGLADQELRMLTIPTLLEAAELDNVDQEFFAALAILVSSSVHVLDAKAFYANDEEEEFHIDAAELAEARKQGSLEHPHTGEIIANFESELIPYFESSNRFRRARAGD